MATIRELNRKRGKKIVPENVITYPEDLEIKYGRDLVRIIRGMRIEVMKQLEPIIQRMEAEEIKTDALDDVRLIETVESIDVVMGRELNRSEWVRNVRTTAEGVSNHNARELGEIITIDPNNSADQSDIDAFIRENVDLIQGFGSQTQQRMRERVARAIREGTNGKQLRDIIQRTFGVSESRARLLARDQVGKLNGDLNRNRQTRAGVTQYKWLTVNDERVRGKKRSKNGKIVGRGRHWQLHGKIFSWDKAPQVSTDGRHEHPGGDYQCRCQAIPVIDFDTIGKKEKAPDLERVVVPEPALPPIRTAPTIQRTTRTARPRATTIRRPPVQNLAPTDAFLQPEIAMRLRVNRSVRDIARDLRITERRVRNIAERLGLSHLT